jgi:hypothetical protein
MMKAATRESPLCIPPSQAIADDMDDTDENRTVVRSSNTVWFREHVFGAVQVILVGPEQMRHGQSSCRPRFTVASQMGSTE